MQTSRLRSQLQPDDRLNESDFALRVIDRLKPASKRAANRGRIHLIERGFIPAGE